MEFAQIEIPNIMKSYSNLELPDPDDEIYYIAKTNRIFYIDYEIYREQGTDYSSLTQLIKTIININIEDAVKPVEERQHIVLLIDSPGGDIDIAFSLSDVIKASVTPVYTVALSKTMSAAFIIFLSGHKRFVFQHSQLLCHQGSVSMGGSASEFEEATKNYKKLLDKMKNFILENSKIDAKTFLKNQKKDWYISSSEAVEQYGIADKVIDNLSEILFLDETENKEE